MADRIKGITVEIGGDTTNLTKALSGVNKELKSTQSQLADVRKLLKLDPTNTELLRQKAKLLADAIAESEEKLKKLRDAEAALKDAGVDENSEQFMALEREIAATEAAMAGYKEEAEEGADATEEAGDAAEEASEKSEGLSKALKVAGAAFATMAAAAAAAAVEVGKALVDAAINGGKFADELLTTSTITGVSTEKLQELQYAADLVDVSVDTITRALRKNTQAMAKAAAGNEELQAAYDSLGISVTDADGNLRSSEEVFWEMVDALGQIDNETERDALAMTVLGKSATELNPLIAAGSKRMAELAQKAHDVGYVLDDETLGAFGELDDQMQYLKNGATAAKNAIGTILLPTLTKLGNDGTDLLGKFTTSLLGANGDITQLPQIIADLVPTIVDAISENMPLILEGAMSILFALIDSITANLPALMDKLVPLIVDLLQALVQRLPDILKALVQMVVSLISALAQAMPSILPAIVDALLSIIDLLLDPNTIWTLTVAVTELVIAVVQGLIKSLPKILERLASAFKTFIEGIFKPDTSKWSDGFKAIVNKLIEGLNWVIAKPFEGLNAILRKIRDISIFGAHPFDWIQEINIPKIPLLANGGILMNGSAIVGEAGPELLTNVGGRSIVQPLTANVDTGALAAAMNERPVQVVINYTGNLAALGELLAPQINISNQRVGGSLA